MLLSFILIVVAIVCVLLFALPFALFGLALFQGWFTLPHPEPDRERK